jgi:hypothetical protein
VVAQLVEDRVHAERRGDRLDQDRRLDRAAVEAERLLGDQEGVAPQRRLVLRLELRDVEVRAPAALQERVGVAVHVEAEVHERSGHLPAVQLQVRLGQVQPARAHMQHRGVVAQRVVLAVLRVLDRPADRVGQVDLALDHVAPVGRVRVLEVGHEAARARVERVDDHLAAGGAGDLDAPVLQRVRHRRHGEVLRRRDEVERLAGVKPRLELLAGVQQLEAACVELLVQTSDQCERVVGQRFVVAVLQRCTYLHPITSSSASCR